MNCKIQILLLVVITVFCAPPPKVPPYFKITAAKPTLKGVKKNSPNLRKMEGGDPNAIFNYTEATINITKDSNIEHYYSVISTINVPDGAFFPEFLFSTSKEKGIHLNMTSFECKVIDATTKKEFTDKNCTPEFTESSSDYVFKCKCGFGNNEQLIFNYTYIITRDEKDILFRQEPVYISSLYSGGDCFYRFVIPEDYKNLGLRYNNFQKESSCSYIYNGSCPKDNLIDVIKFSPRLTHWKNSMSQSIESTSNFTNDLNLTFLRMYKQGRNRNKNYKLTTFDGEELNDSAIITDYVYQKVALKANGKNRVGVNLTTAYSNNLDDEFILEVPDEFYDNIQDIDQEIKDKADEVLRNASYYSGYPDCRDAFVKSLNVTLNLAMDYQFVLHTPLMWIDKAQTWELADQLGVLDLVRYETLTCYNGIQGDGCGHCPSCKLRNDGLHKYLALKATREKLA